MSIVITTFCRLYGTFVFVVVVVYGFPSPPLERRWKSEIVYLYIGSYTNWTATSRNVISLRYNEVCDPGYNFGSGFSSGTGHFTQVVWKGSTTLGIGRAEVTEGRMKCAYIVGRYKPAGNMMGDFPENVLKGNFDRASYCATIGKGRKRFFDQQGQALVIGSPMSAVDVPSATTGPAEFQRQHNGLLNSKKKKTAITNMH